jgi:hypothetical protein
VKFVQHEVTNHIQEEFMKRIDLLTFGSQIFNDDHLALPVTSYAQNTWETGIARTINTAIFMTQLLESRKNSTDLSHYKFTAEEEKIYLVISQKISGIKLPEKITLSEYMLDRLKKQLTEWLSQWPNVADEFPAKIKFQQLLSMLLNSQNILAGSFPNYLHADPAPAVLECMFGMLRIEIIIQGAIMNSQKDLAAHCELEKLLEVTRNPTIYNSGPQNVVTLKQILQLNSKWTGTFSDWAFNVPEVLKNLVETNQNLVFNSLVREQLLAAESKAIKQESQLITELVQEIKQHQNKIGSKFNKLKSKVSNTDEINLDKYLHAGEEEIKKLEEYKSSLSSSDAAVSAFIKTFLDFHGKNFPTWGEVNQKPLQEIKTITNSLDPTAVKLPVILTSSNKPRPPQTPKGTLATPPLSSSVSQGTASLSASLTVSGPPTTSVSEKENPTPDAKKTSTPTEVLTESPATIGASVSTEISIESKESKKMEVSGNTQSVEISPTPSAPQKNNLEKKEISVNTTPVKPATAILEKSPSSVRVTPIPPGASSLAKRASVFEQSSSGSSSSTSTSFTSSTRRESRASNPKIEALQKNVIIPGIPSTGGIATQALIQSTKNKGLIGSGATGSTTTTSSSSSASTLVIGKG